jgi:hypothetical protein
MVKSIHNNTVLPFKSYYAHLHVLHNVGTFFTNLQAFLRIFFKYWDPDLEYFKGLNPDPVLHGTINRGVIYGLAGIMAQD